MGRVEPEAVPVVADLTPTGHPVTDTEDERQEIHRPNLLHEYGITRREV